MEKTLTTKEVAELLGVSPPRVRQMILKGQLPAEKFGRDLVVKESDLAAVAVRKHGRPAKAKPESERIAAGLATETPAAELPDESSPRQKREKEKTLTATSGTLAKEPKQVKAGKVKRLKLERGDWDD